MKTRKRGLCGDEGGVGAGFEVRSFPLYELEQRERRADAKSPSLSNVLSFPDVIPKASVNLTRAKGHFSTASSDRTSEPISVSWISLTSGDASANP